MTFPMLNSLLDRLFFRLAHALADFVFHGVFGTVELADAATETAHELGYFLAPEQQQYYKKNKHEFRGAEVTEE